MELFTALLSYALIFLGGFFFGRSESKWRKGEAKKSDICDILSFVSVAASFAVIALR